MALRFSYMDLLIEAPCLGHEEFNRTVEAAISSLPHGTGIAGSFRRALMAYGKVVEGTKTNSVNLLVASDCKLSAREYKKLDLRGGQVRLLWSMTRAHADSICREFSGRSVQQLLEEEAPIFALRFLTEEEFCKPRF